MDFRGRLLAGVLPPNAEKRNHSEINGDYSTSVNAAHGLREMQVTGTAQVCSPADLASVRVTVGGGSKDKVNEATNSASRRLEYILQAVRQHGVSDRDTTMRRCLLREGEQYRMDAEVLVTFSDFETMDKVCIVLLEKLDRSVCVGMPQYYHSAECLSDVRRRACALAVENAQRKAAEVSQLLGQALGPPLLVIEEETREWRSDQEEDVGGNHPVAHLPHLPSMPTVTAFSRVSVSFGLRDDSRRNL